MTVEEYFGDWMDVIDRDELVKISAWLKTQNPNILCPVHKDVFKAFRMCSLADCKVIMVGQDPFPQKGVATGILFGNIKTINHKDKNRSNNHVDNLEWMSYSENNEHGECQIKAGKSRRVPIYQCDLQGNVIKEWSCAKVASEELGYSNYSGINQCCKGKIKTYEGYVWKYI